MGSADKQQRWTAIFRRMLFLGMKERPSLDDIADQFMAAEDDRAKQFDSFVKQTELQILQEESPRRSSERNRDEEFSKAQTARRKAFRSCERYRNDLFQKAEAEQDATARSSEEHRMSLFETAQKARKALFDETQAKHIQQNERFVSIAEDLYASGRKKRQDAASKLLEDILAQFNMFLQDTQDTSFMSHLRRVKIIKPNESAQPGDGNIDPPHVAPQFAHVPRTPPFMPHHNPWLPTMKPASPIRVAIQNPIPTGSSTASTVHDPDIIIHNKCQIPIVPPTVATRPLQQDILTFYETVFHQKEAQRAFSFRSMSAAHESDFLAAEDRRDRKISEFKVNFEQTEDELDRRFEDSRTSFDGRFYKKETFRKDAEQLRMQAFDDIMRILPISLDQVKSSFTTRMEAMERDEVQHAASLTTQVTQALSSMELAIRASQEAKNLLFEKSFVKSQPTSLPTPQSLSNPSSRSTSRCSDFIYHDLPPPHLCVIPRDSPAPLFIPIRPYSPLEVPFQTGSMSISEPEKYETGPIVLECQPVIPLKEMAVFHPVKSMHPVTKRLKQDLARFTKEQAQRQVQLIQARKRRFETYAVNEAKRCADFSAEMIRQTEESQERRHTRSLNFLADQQSRAEVFLDGEISRDTYFRTNEYTRSSRFASLLRPWNDGMEREQRVLLAEAHEGESERAKEFAGWIVTIRADFLNKMAVWEDTVTRDESQREERFNSILDE